MYVYIAYLQFLLADEFWNNIPWSVTIHIIPLRYIRVPGTAMFNPPTVAWFTWLPIGVTQRLVIVNPYKPSLLCQVITANPDTDITVCKIHYSGLSYY